MHGLLDRAKEFRSSQKPLASSGTSSNGEPARGTPRTPGELHDQSDLPQDEREAIVAEIERISRENRVTRSPGAFHVHARRRGGLLPVLANLGGALVLALGVWFIFEHFQQEDRELRSGAGITLTTEGRLIEEVRRRSEARIAEKDEEIDRVQAELASIRSQRREIQDEIEAQVRQRELELREQVDAEIEAERARLVDEGLSANEVEELIRDFERRRIAELRRQVEEYRQQLIAEQEARTSELARLEAEASASLEEARRERVAILEEARRNEQELRARFERQLGEQREEVRAAREQLSSLAEQREREASVQEQITGYYQRIRASIADQDYAEAQRLIEQLRSYLDQPSIQALPVVEQRRQAELFILESLSRMVTPQAQRDLEDPEDALLQRAQRYETVVRLVDQARSAREEGQTGIAAERMRAALEEVPGALDEHEARVSQLRAQWEASEQELTERIAELESDVQEAEAEVARLEALRDSMRTDFEDELGAMQGQVASLRDERTELQSALEELRGERAALHSELDDLGDEHAELQLELEDLRGERAELRSALADVRRERDELAAEQPSAQTQAEPELVAEVERLREEVSRLEETEQAIIEIRNAYRDFQRRESEVVEDGDVLSLIEGKLLLDEFLASSGVQRLFPDIDTKLRRYDSAFEESGRRAALVELVDIVYALSGFSSSERRVEFIEGEQARADDPQTAEFLSELRELVAN